MFYVSNDVLHHIGTQMKKSVGPKFVNQLRSPKILKPSYVKGMFYD